MDFQLISVSKTMWQWFYRQLLNFTWQESAPNRKETKKAFRHDTQWYTVAQILTAYRSARLDQCDRIIFLTSRAHESMFSDYSVRTGFSHAEDWRWPPHPCTFLPWLVQILAEKQELQYRARYIQNNKPNTNPFDNRHAGMRNETNSCHVKQYKPDTKKLPCIISPLESTLSHSAAHTHTAKKQKTEDNEAGLICCAVLRGISCFDSE